MHRMVTFVFATNSVEFAIFVYATSLWAAIAASVGMLRPAERYITGKDRAIRDVSIK
jgi:hypothetical protein